MKTAVLDTNVWLSGIFWKGNPSKIIQLGETGKIEIVITKPILEEILEILKRESKFQRFLGDRRIVMEDLIRKILSISKFVETKSHIELIEKDPDDNKILEAAVESKADYIISGDAHLLDIKSFGETKILSPKQFLDLYYRDFETQL